MRNTLGLSVHQLLISTKQSLNSAVESVAYLAREKLTPDADSRKAMREARRLASLKSALLSPPVQVEGAIKKQAEEAREPPQEQIPIGAEPQRETREAKLREFQAPSEDVAQQATKTADQAGIVQHEVRRQDREPTSDEAKERAALEARKRILEQAVLSALQERQRAQESIAQARTTAALDIHKYGEEQSLVKAQAEVHQPREAQRRTADVNAGAERQLRKDVEIATPEAHSSDSPHNERPKAPVFTASSFEANPAATQTVETPGRTERDKRWHDTQWLRGVVNDLTSPRPQQTVSLWAVSLVFVVYLAVFAVAAVINHWRPFWNGPATPVPQTTGGDQASPRTDKATSRSTTKSKRGKRETSRPEIVARNAESTDSASSRSAPVTSDTKSDAAKESVKPAEETIAPARSTFKDVPVVVRIKGGRVTEAHIKNRMSDSRYEGTAVRLVLQLHYPRDVTGTRTITVRVPAQ